MCREFRPAVLSAMAVLMLSWGCAHSFTVNRDRKSPMRGVCATHAPEFQEAEERASQLDPDHACKYIKRFAQRDVIRDSKGESTAAARMVKRWCQCSQTIERLDPEPLPVVTEQDIARADDLAILKTVSLTFRYVGPIGRAAASRLAQMAARSTSVADLEKILDRGGVWHAGDTQGCEIFAQYGFSSDVESEYVRQRIGGIATQRLAHLRKQEEAERAAAVQKAKEEAARADAAAAEAEARKEHDRLWGSNLADWGTRPSNQHAYRQIRSLLLNVKKMKELNQRWTEEKEKNDAAETPDEVTPAEVVAEQRVRIPLFPETAGTFAFIKVLDQTRGEALFQAADGLFVLRLSPGDYLQGFSGQSVSMTAHNRGETMLMTTGDRLPVFISGPSPSRVKIIPGHRIPEIRKRGHHPSRNLEKDLKRKFDTQEAALRKRFEEITLRLPEKSYLFREGPVGVRILAEGDSVFALDRITIGDSRPVYCVEVERACSGVDQTNMTTAEFLGLGR